MGVIRREMNKKEKKYEERFPLDTEKGVLSLLENFHEISQKRFFEGDFDACNLLIDLQIAIEKAGLTRKQKEIIHLLYYKCLTQMEVSEIINASQQAVFDRKQNAIAKIVQFNKKGI